MADSNQIIAAADDTDLQRRIAAIAAAEGITNAEHWTIMNLSRLVSTDLDGEGPNPDSIATVFDYAVQTYNPTPRPGQNMAAVTDDHIKAAIAQVRSSDDLLGMQP